MSQPQPSSEPVQNASHQSRVEAASDACSPKSSGVPEFSPEERRLLLGVAHEAIRSSLDRTDLPLDPPTPHLAEPRGVFTSLYLHGQLRGCVGYVMPISPVYRAVIDTARAAAFEDTRFPAIRASEAPELDVELSVLSVPQPITFEEIKIGRHGLMVSMYGHRGLLLPQVPIEHGWDRETFLAQTCRKAGLPVDAWQKGATIEAFTAEIFGEKNP